MRNIFRTSCFVLLIAIPGLAAMAQVQLPADGSRTTFMIVAPFSGPEVDVDGWPSVQQIGDWNSGATGRLIFHVAQNHTALKVLVDALRVNTQNPLYCSEEDCSAAAQQKCNQRANDIYHLPYPEIAYCANMHYEDASDGSFCGCDCRTDPWAGANYLETEIVMCPDPGENPCLECLGY